MAAGVFAVLGVVLAVGAVVGLLVWVAIRIERKRREAFRAIASQRGWTYAEQAGDPSPRFTGFKPFGQGHSRLARDVLGGMVDGVAFEAFSFRYVVTSGSGKNRHEQTYWFTVLAVPMPLAAPDLTLEPEGLAMKLFDALGGEDIDFESDAFSRRFWVKCRDRKFAYDVITPAMMERLLATPQGWSWQWRGGSLVVSRVGPMRPEDAPGIVALASVFTQDLPRHLLAARPARP